MQTVANGCKPSVGFSKTVAEGSQDNPQPYPTVVDDFRQSGTVSDGRMNTLGFLWSLGEVFKCGFSGPLGRTTAGVERVNRAPAHLMTPLG